MRCIDNRGRAFIVEMQTEWTNIFRKRLIVNGSKAIIKQLDKKSVENEAKLFKDMQPVYVLAVVNSKFTKDDTSSHRSTPRSTTMLICYGYSVKLQRSLEI